jgi:predicted  nucleic acid-binding Zn-ribbon protein
MAEKRAMTSGQQGDERVERLQKRVYEVEAEKKKSEADFQKAMDSINSDYAQLESEMRELRERNKQHSMKQIMAGISASLPQSTGGPVGTEQRGMYVY